jgi:UDP-N-acetylglucosamine 4-epimerase
MGRDSPLRYIIGSRISRGTHGCRKDTTTLNELFKMIRDELSRGSLRLKDLQPVYRDFRPGDVRHSLADISKAQHLLGYQPTHRIGEGLREAMAWYVQDLSKTSREDPGWQNVGYLQS